MNSECNSEVRPRAFVVNVSLNFRDCKIGFEGLESGELTTWFVSVLWLGGIL